MYFEFTFAIKHRYNILTILSARKTLSTKNIVKKQYFYCIS